LLFVFVDLIYVTSLLFVFTLLLRVPFGIYFCCLTSAVRPLPGDYADFVEHFVLFNNALLTAFEPNQKGRRHPLADQAMALADSMTLSLVDGVEVC
jgi:hypothetical protein